PSEVWSKHLDGPISRDEAIEILENVKQLAMALRENPPMLRESGPAVPSDVLQLTAPVLEGLCVAPCIREWGIMINRQGDRRGPDGSCGSVSDERHSS